MVADKQSFEEWDTGLETANPLDYPGYPEKLEGLKEKLPYIKFIEIGINFNTTDSAYDIVLNSDFETKEDLNKYQVSEEHLKVAAKVRDAVSKRAVVDYEY